MPSRHWRRDCDYWYDKEGVLQVRVAEMGNRDYEVLIATHELLEENGTLRRGLREEDIQKFDELWDEEQKRGEHPDEEEPGFNKKAPYLREHTMSDAVERMMIAFWGIPWPDYEKAIDEAAKK